MPERGFGSSGPVGVPGGKASPWPSAGGVAQGGEGLGRIPPGHPGYSDVFRGTPFQLVVFNGLPDPATLTHERDNETMIMMMKRKNEQSVNYTENNRTGSRYSKKSPERLLRGIFINFSKPSDKSKPADAAMRWSDAPHPTNSQTKRLKSSSGKLFPDPSNTFEATDVDACLGDTPDSSEVSKTNFEKTKGKSEMCLTSRLNGAEEGDTGETENPSSESKGVDLCKSLEAQEKISDYKDTCEGGPCGTEVAGKSKSDSRCKRPSEIPKLKSIIKTTSLNRWKVGAVGSKLPVKTGSLVKEPVAKEPVEQKPSFEGQEADAKQPGKQKKDKTEEKVNLAMKQEFSEIVPLYENELKKITDVWVNTIYCSLTLRANLVKLMFQAFPNVNKSQFHLEDERLLFRIAQAKNYTKSEADNLVQFLKALIANREKTKEDYLFIKANKEVAEIHNYDWRGLTKKIADLGDEIRQFKVDAPEAIKKKEALEVQGTEKLQKLECYVHKKTKEIKKFESQLAVLRQRDKSYKGGIFLKLEDYKDIKGDVLSLKNVETSYKELKEKYKYQNEAFEKQIKDLERLLEEKKETLERERAGKEKLQRILSQMQENKRELSQTIGKEQADYFCGGTVRSRIKRRELLWVAAVKLVLKGFLMQINKLERDKNKMLLELQSNNVENFTTLATAIIHKENFIDSIRQQMNAYQRACKQDVSYADDRYN